MRGRHPSGPEIIEKLTGSPEAKLRFAIVLKTISGDCRVGEACQRLGIKKSRFEQLRDQTLQGGVAAAELRPVGRKPHREDPLEAEVRRLQERIAQLEGELHAALIRAEIAVTLPQVGGSEGKKTTRPKQHRHQKRLPMRKS